MKRTVPVNKHKLRELVLEKRLSLGYTRDQFVEIFNGKAPKIGTLSKIENLKEDSYAEGTLLGLSELFEVKYEEFIAMVTDNNTHTDLSGFGPNTYKNASEDLINLFETPYTIAYPGRDDFLWIENVEEQLYGEKIANNYDTLTSWYNKNPKCTTVLKNKNNRLCGYLIFLPVKKEIFTKFCRGEIYDKEIGEVDVLSPDDKSRTEYIYVENFSVISGNNTMNLSGIIEYLQEIPHLLNDLCDLSKSVTLFTVIGKTGDEIFVKEIGFSKLTVPPHSRTKLDVYFINIAQLITTLTKKFPSKK